MDTTYCITDAQFSDWIPYIRKNNKIQYINDIKDIKEIKDIKDIGNIKCYKIIPISKEQYEKYSDESISIFVNKSHNIEILNNKGMFAKFMLDNNYHEHIPIVCYYSFGENVYKNEQKIRKMIKKPNNGYGGINIKIIYSLDITEKNVVVSEYIEHDIYYVGHMLVHKGILLKIIFFYCHNNNKNLIKKGSIVDYKIINKVDADLNIFENIFKKLDYSGFACADFIIHNGIIKIFEINPRPGGSLIKNEKCFDEFMNVIVDKKL